MRLDEAVAIAQGHGGGVGVGVGGGGSATTASYTTGINEAVCCSMGSMLLWVHPGTRW